MDKPKHKHLKSITPKILDESIITRYIIEHPLIKNIYELMRKYINIYNINFDRHSVSCVLKLLTTTNRARYIRNIRKPNLNYFSNFSKNLILSGINQNRYHFSHIYEKRTTFSSSFRDLTKNHYLNQPMPMYEIKLNQILAKNRRLIYLLDRSTSNPCTTNFTIKEIKLVNGRN